MSLGICLKAVNSIKLRKPLDFFFEFLPQLILFESIFGYMVLLIIVKWRTFYEDTSRAPSIISYMIDMFLKMGTISGDHLLFTRKSLNETAHVFILLIAFLCIPVMLVVKPLII
jgi:V-type H+-transporting ATPase subunit a